MPLHSRSFLSVFLLVLSQAYREAADSALLTQRYRA